MCLPTPVKAKQPPFGIFLYWKLARGVDVSPSKEALLWRKSCEIPSRESRAPSTRRDNIEPNRRSRWPLNTGSSPRLSTLSHLNVILTRSTCTWGCLRETPVSTALCPRRFSFGWGAPGTNRMAGLGNAVDKSCSNSGPVAKCQTTCEYRSKHTFCCKIGRASCRERV